MTIASGLAKISLQSLNYILRCSNSEVAFMHEHLLGGFLKKNGRLIEAEQTVFIKHSRLQSVYSLSAWGKVN